MKAMALDIEKLKWRLIEQDQEAERQRRGGRLALKKSRSLEEESAGKGRRASYAFVRAPCADINYIMHKCTHIVAGNKCQNTCEYYVLYMQFYQ